MRGHGVRVASMLLCATAVLPPAARAGAPRTAQPANAMAGTAQIVILDTATLITPTASDYAIGYVDAAGASGQRVRIKTNSMTGMALMVRCSDPAPQIALSDLLVRTLTPPGPFGFSLASYTPIQAVDQTLWTTTIRLGPWTVVTTDLRIQNLMNYDDQPGGGTTGYTNTLTYTVAVQ